MDHMIHHRMIRNREEKIEEIFRPHKESSSSQKTPLLSPSYVHSNGQNKSTTSSAIAGPSPDVWVAMSMLSFSSRACGQPHVRGKDDLLFLVLD
ncbi:hypothetical protein D5086_003595 [Populus alba]|uniref:Uncharacterized protein n=1 Tax=Populus alba TaxID=43335 RepID=A0ACC4D560_POPAL